MVQANRTGHNGKDILIKVPVGTIVLCEDKKKYIKTLKKLFLAVEGGIR